MTIFAPAAASGRRAFVAWFDRCGADRLAGVAPSQPGLLSVVDPGPWRPLSVVNPVCGHPVRGEPSAVTGQGDNVRVPALLRRLFDPRDIKRVGETPDYRFSLANERTFLAWIRTGLALTAGGLAAVQFLPDLPMAHLREALGVTLMLLGAAVSVWALTHWTRTERAMRLGEDLPPSRFPALLAATVTVGSLLLATILLVQAVA